jgi:hypothetical protein
MENGLAEYGFFIRGIKELIYRRQYEAMKRVNEELIQLYWEIGEEITRQQNEKGWGKSVVEVLAKELQKEFPGVKSSNLAPLVRDLGKQNMPPLVTEISWTKNIVIMQG